MKRIIQNFRCRFLFLVVIVFGALRVPAVPVITELSPVSGIVGAPITIYGANFSPNAGSNLVHFGSVSANVVSATTSNLVATLPAGTIFGPITVTVGGLTAYSMQMFEPTFIGNGSNITTGSFGTGFTIPTDGGPGSTILADIDGDGKPDIVYVTDNNIVCIMQNISTNGTPLSAASFAPAVELQFPTNGVSGNAYRVRAVDLDGDGRLDLIAAEVNGNRVSVFHNISTPGTITTNSFEPTFALIAGNDCRGVAAADLDGDGRVDIVGLNYGDGTISIFQNIGTPGVLNASSFAAPVLFAAPGGPYEAVIADLDGDGRPDLAVVNANNNTVSVYQNESVPGVLTTNSFAPRLDLPGDTSLETITAVDLDGDGKLDLVVGSVQGDEVDVYYNLATPGLLTTNSFATWVSFGTPGWMHTVSVADINGDGKPDLVVVGELNSYMGIFQNTATLGGITSSSLAPMVQFSTGWNAWGVSAGDIDGDGRPDIVFCNYYDHNIEIYQNATPFGLIPAAPVITGQPTNLTVAVNGTAMFTVAATGMPAPAYQWSFDGTNISGAIGATLTLTNVQLDQSGTYSVLVSNVAGSVFSSNAELTVYVPPTPPTILSQTANQVVILGNSVTFSVTASGAGPLSYFWSQNGTLIPGATNASYTLVNAPIADSGSVFACLVTNVNGSASSSNMLLKVIVAVANGLCNSAIVITNASYTNTQSTLQADAPGNPEPDCVYGFGHGVWYEFTAPVAGLLEVDTFGSDYDTGLALYTGTCGALTEVACNDDADGLLTSQVNVPTTAGTTYFILAGGYDSDAGNLELDLNYYTPPAFSVEPTNEAVVVSSNASFSPTLTGSLPMSFQWYFNNAALTDGGGISGSTNSTLLIADVQTSEGGNYQLVASNYLGMATSTVAVLTPVILPPSFVQPPVSQLVGTGSNVNFFAVMAGTPPFSFQWSLNGSVLADDGVHIVGSATASLTISNLTSADAGSYSLTVANVSGSASASATLTLLVAPTITQQPIGRSVPPGLPTIFVAAATGIPTPSYQWQLNGTNLPGATSLSYTNAGIGTDDLGFYQLVASNLMGVAVSSNAQLTFGPVAAWGLNTSGECLPPPGLSNVVAVAGNYQEGYALTANGNIVNWGRSLTLPANATNVIALSIPGVSGSGAGLRADGSVVTWGAVPEPPATVSNLVAVAAGNTGFCLGLRAEGSVVGWGGGNLTGIPAGLNHVTAIACGNTHVLALRSDGTVVAWGTDAGAIVPAGLANVTAIAAGNTHSLALKANGTVTAWGSGTGTNVPAGLTNVSAIATENYAFSQTLSLALLTNGTVVAWGDDPYGETNPPSALTNLFAAAIGAAPNHGLALVNAGQPQLLQSPVGRTMDAGRSLVLQASAVGAAPLSYQWLVNGTSIPGATNTSLVIANIQLANAGNYQLFVSNAIGSALSLSAPVTVVSNSALTFLAQAGASATNVYQGGIGTFYGGAVLGNGPLSYQWFASPTNRNYAAVAGATNDTLILNPALAVQSGNYYVAVSNQVGGITSAPVNMQVYFARSWGYLAVSNPPVNVTNAIAVATGGYLDEDDNYLTLTANGKMTAWANYQSLVLAGVTNPAVSNSFVTAISAGSEDALALKSDGTVFAWGLGLYGETNVPSTVSGITAISCGGYHDLALTASGTVVGWGGTGAFNFGQATNNPAATNVVAIAAGSLHSLALRADGSVVAWGSMTAGATLVPATASSNIIAIAAGNNFSEALRANGTVVQWGSELANYSVPLNLSNVVAISASGTHATALLNNGTVISWGLDNQLVAAISVPSDVTNVIAVASGGDHDFALLGNRAPAFTVQPWNRTVFNTTTSVWFCGKCAGAQPVTYQWQYNGTNLPAATNDTLTINAAVNGQRVPLPLPAGVYQLIASNAYGVTASKYAQLAVLIPLNVALNNSNVLWTTSGNQPWFGETNYTHDGVSAAQSGFIGPDQQSVLQATLVTNVAGNVIFWWEVSSEPFLDTLAFSVNGNIATNISGSVNWQQVSVPLSAGTNVLVWTYSPQSIYGAGLDAGWVDQVSFVGVPQFLKQPGSVTVNYGANVTLATVATGASPLGYQWQQNGIRVGGNSSSLPLYSVSRAQDGNYSVTVTNAGGAITSSNAVVTVNVPQVLGAPVMLANGVFQFTSTDEGGGLLTAANLPHLQAQVSTNLVSWLSLPNALSLTNGRLLLQDSATSNAPARFYRIVEQ